jgi:hypothetical protein
MDKKNNSIMFHAPLRADHPAKHLFANSQNRGANTQGCNAFFHQECHTCSTNQFRHVHESSMTQTGTYFPQQHCQQYFPTQTSFPRPFHSLISGHGDFLCV